MSCKQYIDQTKEIYHRVIDFINKESWSDDDYEALVYYIKNNQISKNQSELSQFLRLLSKISKSHYRYPEFDRKINQIILSLESEIKQNLSNSELFNLFKSNKQVLLFLFKSRIIIVDEKISQLLLHKSDTHFCHFFYPEIKPFISEEERSRIEDEMKEKDENIFDNFEEKRKNGQNDTYICTLIREDSIEDFISHVNRTNISLSKSVIKGSIFETNSFLNKNNPTLIEYATFFGSIQIFKYLRNNNVELTSSLWLYSIHSNNSELIQNIEESKILPDDQSFTKCFFESIKCHHNDVANYIQNNLLKNTKENFKEKFIDRVLRFSNFSFIPDNLNDYPAFFYFCSYNYNSLVDIFIEMKKNEIEEFLNKINEILLI